MAIHLSTAFRGSPQSARLLRDDKPEFSNRRAATQQSIQMDRHALVPRARDDKSEDRISSLNPSCGFARRLNPRIRQEVQREEIQRRPHVGVDQT